MMRASDFFPLLFKNNWIRDNSQAEDTEVKAMAAKLRAPGAGHDSFL